jgi:general secretion pathway protein D
VVKSFYLANADVKHTANMIKTLVKTRDVYVDEKLNLLVIRDTPEAIRIAERLVANQDLAEPEVMLEVEVLEVGTTLLSELGIRWPDQISAGVVGAAGVPGQLTLREWQNRDSSLVRLSVTDPLLIVNLKNQNGRTNILANPRIRVKNKEKAKVHIGDKVPVITTTAAGTGFVSESVNYLDVGLKLEVEPSVFLEDEVGIKVGLEVSSIVDQIESKSGTLTYRVGTRNAATTLRLRDGETQVLAGLISDEDRRNAAKVPLLGDLPVVGRLFTNNNDTASKTEIVLLITPRVVRNLQRPGIRLEEFPSGTEGAIGAAPLMLQNAPRTTVQ